MLPGTFGEETDIRRVGPDQEIERLPQQRGMILHARGRAREQTRDVLGVEDSRPCGRELREMIEEQRPQRGLQPAAVGNAEASLGSEQDFVGYDALERRLEQ